MEFCLAWKTMVLQEKRNVSLKSPGYRIFIVSDHFATSLTQPRSQGFSLFRGGEKGKSPGNEVEFNQV